MIFGGALPAETDPAASPHQARATAGSSLTHHRAHDRTAGRTTAGGERWMCTLYNFVRIHQTTRVTPTMAAGVADHP
jgi:hypothetical protein